MKQNYLNSVQIQFEYYKILGTNTFYQLEENELFWHLTKKVTHNSHYSKSPSKNIKSRFTDFLNSEKGKGWQILSVQKINRKSLTLKYFLKENIKDILLTK